jgi:hypothetical protein
VRGLRLSLLGSRTLDKAPGSSRTEPGALLVAGTRAGRQGPGVGARLDEILPCPQMGCGVIAIEQSNVERLVAHIEHQLGQRSTRAAWPDRVEPGASPGRLLESNRLAHHSDEGFELVEDFVPLA